MNFSVSSRACAVGSLLTAWESIVPRRSPELVARSEPVSLTLLGPRVSVEKTAEGCGVLLLISAQIVGPTDFRTYAAQWSAAIVTGTVSRYATLVVDELDDVPEYLPHVERLP